MGTRREDHRASRFAGSRAARQREKQREVTNEYDVRARKRAALLKKGVTPYPSRASRSHTVRAASTLFERLAELATVVCLAGRLRSIRHHGGSTFASIEDETGQLQVYLKRDVLRSAFKLFHDLVDVGDFIEVRGTLFRTRAGEESLHVASFRVLAKALAPLPEKWHGLTDTEVRYRRRELDLLSNPEVKAVAKLRIKLIASIRAFLDREGFMEVETPILQPIAGGAAARPFVTHHNALDATLYLRIAPELYLKRLLVGGFEKVYELGRSFRNEGIDRTHNPEFTELEFYWAYQDYQGLAEFVEKLILELATNVLGEAAVTVGGKKISLKAPFARESYENLIKRETGLELAKLTKLEKLTSAVQGVGVMLPPGAQIPKIIDELFKEKVRSHLIDPTFVIDHPALLSPLAKAHAKRQQYAERFQLFIGGYEIVNAFSEENDPVLQRERFAEQEALRRGGDEEAHASDEPFLEALEMGMPPAAGAGIGIDRLTMVFSGTKNLKEVILFPTLKPELSSTRQ